jgi:signal transduction histidine kinase
MQIRNQLTWTISITAFAAITTLGLLVYIFTARFHAREFFDRLEERVDLTELVFLEKNQAIEEAVRNKFLQTLDEEEEYAISMQPSGLDSLSLLYPSDIAEQLKRKETARFWQGERQGVGKHYHLPGGEFVVVVTAVDTFGRSKLDFLRKILLIGGSLAILLLVLVDRIGIARALRPLENKILSVSRIGAKNLDLRLSVRNPSDEIGKLALAFNRMLDRLQASFEAQRHFVRNASHEMRNPLTAISGEAEVLLAKDRSIEEYKEALTIIQQEADRLQVLIQQLLDLEKTEALSDLTDPEEFYLDQCLLETLEQFPSQRIQLEFKLDQTEPKVLGNHYLVRTALQNVIDNALKYSGEEPVSIVLSREEASYQIRIQDRGIGIEQEDLERIFQPFFRSANARSQQGHGIGLTLVNKIVSLHKGNIRILSKADQGTTVVLSLPAA